MCFLEHCIKEFLRLERVEEVGVEGVEVELNARSLHDEILGYPEPVVIPQDLLEFLTLVCQVHLIEVVEDEGSFVLDEFGWDDDVDVFLCGSEEGRNVGGIGY